MQYEKKSLLSFMAIVIAPNIFQITLALLMFFKPGKISNKIIADEIRQDQILNDEHISKIEQLCISVLGLYMACHYLSDLIFNISSYIKAVSDVKYIDISGVNYSNFIITISLSIAELIISFFLITQNRKIQNFIEKIRNQSRDNVDNCEK